MLFLPVNPGWRIRPGWSEFGAWRAHGSHRGVDLYVPRGTLIYGSGQGAVKFIGFDRLGFGHYVDIAYGGYTVRNAHLLSRPNVAVGQRVTHDTVLGTVGQSGNAQNIVWQGLIHPHVETWVTATGVRVNPLSIMTDFHRGSIPPSTPASGPPSTPASGEASAPIVPLPQIIEQETEDDMIRTIRYTGNPRQWAIVAPYLDGGYIYTADDATAQALAGLYVRNWGSGDREGWDYQTADKARFDAMLAQARAVHEQYVRNTKSATGVGAVVNVDEIAKAVNDDAARRMQA